MRVLFAILFFVSGAAALVYEVVWTRQLTLVLGVTAPAVAAVLATFMAGLALGGALSGRFLRGRKPLLAYAALELAIGLLGAASPFVLGALPSLLVRARHALGDGAWLVPARAAIAAIVLLPPTTLMGATLPALAGAAAAAGARVGRSVAVLYAMNTLGAVAGALVAAFFAIERFGMRGALNAAAAANVGVAVAAAALALAAGARARGREERVFEPVAAAPPRARRVALGIAAASGAAALANEVLWTRTLIYAVGDNSAYAFAEMLAMVLLGMALGAALAAPWIDRVRRPLLALAALQAGAAVAVVASAELLDARGRGAGIANPWGDSALPWSAFVRHGLLASARVVLLPSALLGATFPVVARIVAASRATAAGDVGRALAWNTVGAIAGAVAGGFVLLPALGFARGLLATGALHLACAAVALAAARVPRPRAVAASAAVAAAFALAAVASLTREDAARRALVHDPRDSLVFYENGPSSSIGVVRDGRTGASTLYVDGDAQAGSDPSMMLHLRLLGHLPALLHAEPKSALVVGFGAGVTLGALASHPIERLEVCELSPSVLRASGWFEPGNGGVLRDPRLRVTFDDGRNHLLATPRTYDVITTDPIDPDDAGVTSLYSREFYALEASRLNEGGVACQWLSTRYSLDLLRSLIESFRASFPDCFLFDADFTTVLVGRKPGSAPQPFARLERAFADPRVAASLAQVGLDSPMDLLSLQLAGPAELAQFCAGAAPNTDDRPRIETEGPRSTFGLGPDAAVAKQRALLSLRNFDRRGVVADWSEALEARLKDLHDSVSRAMRTRLLARADDALVLPGMMMRVRALRPPSPRVIDLMFGFDACEPPTGADPTYDWLVADGSAGFDFPADQDGAVWLRLARDRFERAAARRHPAPRAQLGLAAICAAQDDPAPAIDASLALLRSARYASEYLSPFVRLQMDRLAALADDPARGAASRAALARLTGDDAGPAPGAWSAWWKSRRDRARLDAESGRVRS